MLVAPFPVLPDLTSSSELYGRRLSLSGSDPTLATTSAKPPPHAGRRSLPGVDATAMLPAARSPHTRGARQQRSKLPTPTAMPHRQLPLSCQNVLRHQQQFMRDEIVDDYTAAVSIVTTAADDDVSQSGFKRALQDSADACHVTVTRQRKQHEQWSRMRKTSTRKDLSAHDVLSRERKPNNRKCASAERLLCSGLNILSYSCFAGISLSPLLLGWISSQRQMLFTSCC